MISQHWDITPENLRRIQLSSSSSEYKDVFNRFDATMKNRYHRIISIARIQNERWFKQVKSIRNK